MIQGVCLQMQGVLAAGWRHSHEAGQTSRFKTALGESSDQREVGQPSSAAGGCWRHQVAGAGVVLRRLTRLAHQPGLGGLAPQVDLALVGQLHVQRGVYRLAISSLGVWGCAVLCLCSLPASMDPAIAGPL